MYQGLFAPVEAAAQAAFGTPPNDATPPLPTPAYTGRYANPYVGTATVTASDEKLSVALGPQGRTVYPLTPFDRDTFLCYASPELPQMPSPLRFRIGPDGRADAMTLDSLDASGLGTLTRVAP